MRRSFYKRCCYAIITVDVMLWAALLWMAPDEWISLTALFIVIVGVAVSYFRAVARAGDQIGSFAPESAANAAQKKEPISERSAAP